VDGNLVASLPHAAPVVSVAYSPDGRWLATGTAEGDSAARIYDARTLEPVLTWQAGNEEMREVVFSRSGRWFGAVATDGPYGVFDGNDGWRRIEHEHATAGVGVDFAFSDDESRFGVTRGNRAAVLSLPEGAIVRELSNSDFVGETNMEFDAWINRIAFSPDSKYFVTGGRDGTARIWDLESGEEVARMRHTSAIVDVAFTPDGQRLATAAWDSTRLWSLPFGEEITRAAWDTSDVVLDVNADGSTFVSGGPDGNLAIWRPARSDLEWSARMSDDVVAVACSPDGSKVAAADDAHQVRLWNAAGEPLPGSARLFVVRRLGFSNTGQFVIARDLNGLHRLDPNGTGDAVVVARTADSMAFAGDSAVVEPRGLDHVRFLDTVSGETRHDIVEDDVVEPVSIDPTGRYALTSFLEGQDGSGRKAFHVWNVADGTIRWQGTPDTAFLSASISASGDRALVYGDREAFLMTPSGAPRRIEAAGARGFTYLGFNPGETMIAGIAGQDVYIWPVTLDREPFVLTHNSDLSSIDFSDDARYLVTAAGAIISVWNLADGVLLSQWDAPGHVRQACMLGQDAHVVTGDTRDNLTVWDWKPFDLVDRTCALLTRNFTDEEWQRYFPGEAYRATCPGLDVTER
jgi:WD40 repeat protein